MQVLLNKKERSIIPIAAFTANGDIAKLKKSLNSGLNSGLTINEIKEVLVQMYAYAGFPRSLNGLGIFMSVITERKNQGINDVLGAQSTLLSNDKTSLELGTENQTRLIGHPVSGDLFEFAPAIDQYLKAHLFGDIFQRDALSWKERELATIAALANMQGVNSQLQAHYSISAYNGMTLEQLNEFINVLHKECNESVALNAKQVLEVALA